MSRLTYEGKHDVRTLVVGQALTGQSAFKQWIAEAAAAGRSHLR